MNWDAIGAIGEVVGALLVVGSLLFVGFQIRQSVRESRAATMDRITSGWVDFYYKLSQDADLSEIMRKGMNDLSSLTDPEHFRFNVLLIGMFRSWHNAWYQWRLGVFDMESWDSQMRTIRSFLTLPSALAVWEERKIVLPEAFRSYIEAEVADKGAAYSYEWARSIANNPLNKVMESEP